MSAVPAAAPLLASQRRAAPRRALPVEPFSLATLANVSTSFDALTRTRLAPCFSFHLEASACEEITLWFQLKLRPLLLFWNAVKSRPGTIYGPERSDATFS